MHWQLIPGGSDRVAKILLIEDTPANAALATKLLRTASYEVVVAVDAGSGIELARSEHPDLVLMDLGLPDMDGWAALGLLRSDPSTADLRVVAFTAHAMVGDRARALEAGFDGYLSKPIDFASFLPEIAGFLA